jgi:hypothetical protein
MLIFGRATSTNRDTSDEIGSGGRRSDNQKWCNARLSYARRMGVRPTDYQVWNRDVIKIILNIYLLIKQFLTL